MTEKKTTHAGCQQCRADCCRYPWLVEIGSRDNVPAEYVHPDLIFGLPYMGKHPDGSCLALDPVTHMCKIYAQRPTICREVLPGDSFCEYAKQEMAARSKASDKETK